MNTVETNSLMEESRVKPRRRSIDSISEMRLRLTQDRNLGLKHSLY